MTKIREDGRMMPRLIECVKKEYITPNLLRVTFSGDDLIGFPEGHEGGIIKLFFANRESGILELPTRDEEKIYWPKHKPVSRAYTVRHYDAKTNLLDIDFVPHSKDSPASGWAISAQPGDTIGLGGPGNLGTLLPEGDWHIIAGDTTALPAISAILEKLPDDAVGYAFIEVELSEDIHPLEHPENVEIHWFVRHPVDDPQPLIAAIKQAVPKGDRAKLSAFIAGENDTVIETRKWVRQEYGIERKSMHAVPYWRRGQDEDEYHQARHVAMDEAY